MVNLGCSFSSGLVGSSSGKQETGCLCEAFPLFPFSVTFLFKVTSLLGSDLFERGPERLSSLLSLREVFASAFEAGVVNLGCSFSSGLVGSRSGKQETGCLCEAFPLFPFSVTFFFKVTSLLGSDLFERGPERLSSLLSLREVFASGFEAGVVNLGCSFSSGLVGSSSGKQETGCLCEAFPLFPFSVTFLFKVTSLLGSDLFERGPERLSSLLSLREVFASGFEAGVVNLGCAFSSGLVGSRSGKQETGCLCEAFPLFPFSVTFLFKVTSLLGSDLFEGGPERLSSLLSLREVFASGFEAGVVNLGCSFSSGLVGSSSGKQETGCLCEAFPLFPFSVTFLFKVTSLLGSDLFERGPERLSSLLSLREVFASAFEAGVVNLGCSFSSGLVGSSSGKQETGCLCEAFPLFPFSVTFLFKVTSLLGSDLFERGPERLSSLLSLREVFASGFEAGVVNLGCSFSSGLVGSSSGKQETGCLCEAFPLFPFSVTFLFKVTSLLGSDLFERGPERLSSFAITEGGFRICLRGWSG